MRTIYVHGAGPQDEPEIVRARLDRMLFGAATDTTRLAYYADVLHRRPTRSLLAQFRVKPATTRGPSVPPLAAADRGAEGPSRNPGGELPSPVRGTPLITGATDSRLEALALRIHRHHATLVRPVPGWLERTAFRVIAASLLHDVGTYFFGDRADEMREPLRRILRDVGEPTMLIAHSLGSVIAYDVLREPEFAGTEIAHWLTVGSPLAVDEIRWLVTTATGRPASIPPSVTRWTNVADPYDPVALDATLRDEYHPTNRIDEYRISLRCRTHHAFAAYLETDGVRRVVNEATVERAR